MASQAHTRPTRKTRARLSTSRNPVLGCAVQAEATQVTTVEPVEWRSRREALGLSQDAYAAWIGTSQAAVSNWEHGRRSPRDPVSVRMRVSELEDIMEDLVAQIVADVTVGGDPVELVTYATDEDWWAVSPGAERAGLPAQLHRVATARAAVELAEEFGCRVEIVAG